MNRLPKGALIYFLGFYVLLQFVWWAYMLIDLNAEIYELKLSLISVTEPVAPEKLILKAELDRKLSHRIWMVLGEGAVFVFILQLGFYAVRKSIAKELTLAEQQKNFLLSITHELKSPLAAIKLQLQTLNARELPEEKKKQLYERSLKDADRLQKLVENLLLVNRLESGKVPLAKEQMDLGALIMDLIRTSYADELEKGKIELSLQPDIHLNVDSLAIQSVVSNLVDNALKYAPGSVIAIDLKYSDEVILSVSDKGPGIPEDHRQRIFERFFRLGSEDTRMTKGTGIGLYLTRSLVQLHGGSISVRANQPSGAVFTVTLPKKGEK